MRELDILLAGDVILDEPDPDHWLQGLRKVTHSADLTIGHLEVPHTSRGTESSADVPAPAADPTHLQALARAGFAAMTLAGNHIADRGPEGIADTTAMLGRLGIACCGAGASIDEARRPAILTRNGVRVALLSYNCVGPESSWALPHRAGCAYVRVEPADGGPISPAANLTQLDTRSVADISRDIARVRAQADLLIVALHKGIVHRPAEIASYERPLAHAAIDAGADIVVGHHAHIIRGIEIYRGRPIYHGLGNGCVVTRALTPNQSHPKRAEWARRRKELFGFEPDPAYILAPFHPEAIHALMARVHYREGAFAFGFVPIHVEPPGRPVIPTPEQASRTVAYVASITERAGLPPLTLAPRGNMIGVSP
ncbi:MAG TPA: CapA family protein [Steroidobacteraceae bacterium]|jgi:poly-gamma-glutamate synthesis protein (capsule biosynthesis protein)